MLTKNIRYQGHYPRKRLRAPLAAHWAGERRTRAGAGRLVGRADRGEGSWPSSDPSRRMPENREQLLRPRHEMRSLVESKELTFCQGKGGDRPLPGLVGCLDEEQGTISQSNIAGVLDAVEEGL